MKKIFSQIALMAVFVLALALPAFAQSTISTDVDYLEGGLLVTVDMEIDSIDTVYSDAFAFGQYDDDSYYTYPVAYGYQFTSAADEPKVMVKMQGSFDAVTWTLIDTVSAVTDSTETFNVGTMNFNNKKFPYYRAFVEGKTGNRADCIGKFYVYAYRKGLK
jgi:hypothetical protein